MHPEEPAVGDRPCVRDREPPRALPPADDPGRPVPHHAGPQLRELVRRITAVEHVEHVLELDAGEVRERIRAAHDPVELVDRDLFVGADRDDLLREHVERVARNLRLLDRTVEHPARYDRRLEQIGAELRENPAL